MEENSCLCPIKQEAVKEMIDIEDPKLKEWRSGDAEMMAQVIEENSDKLPETVSQSDERPRCELCGKQFRRQETLKEHIKTVHEGERAHACSTCTKTFGYNSALVRHEKVVHEGEKSHLCKVCGKGFGIAANLRRHSRAVHEGVKHGCNLCDKSYSDPHHLTLHMRTAHFGEKFQCEHCNASFTRKDRFTRHIKTKTTDCRICAMSFQCSGSQKLHMKEKHQGVSGKSWDVISSYIMGGQGN